MRHLLLSISFLFSAGFSFAQVSGQYGNGSKAPDHHYDFQIPERTELNYDESNVPDYSLSDPLTGNDGTRITTVKQWEKQRRAEIFELFSSQMYGRTPKEKLKVTYETLSENSGFLNGKATAKQVKFIFTNGQKKHEAVLLLVLPNRPKGKVPVFAGYNFMGNHSTIADTIILFSPYYSLPVTADNTEQQTERTERGRQSNRWPYELIIDRGYGIATMSYQDIYPDDTDMEDHSIVSLFSDYDPDSRAPDRWKALGAWAWGLSRIVDYLETQKRVDMNKIITMGHSRQGKASLWAGAQDKRFKIVISNNSGCAGAALSKRVYGESIARILRISHWFCPTLSRYANNEAGMPFDQHELVALIAPRKVYIASAVDDLGADPKGEFLSGYHAGPVYELYGLKGLGTDKQPPLNRPVMHDMGYHVREGGHDVTDYDWMRFMDFADKHFGRK